MSLSLKENRILLFACVTMFVFLSFKTVFTHNFVLSSPNARFTDTIVQHLNTDIIKCMSLCDILDECTSVNHNSDTRVCELTTYVPGLVTPAIETEVNWKVYYDGKCTFKEYETIHRFISDAKIFT
jgi:hypothetical protein